MHLSDRVKSEVSLRAVAERHRVEWDARKSVPARGDYWAPCPFHTEATASFHVVEPAGRGGFFRCFGCEAKGTVIDFVMAANGLSALDAMKRLAEDHGVEAERDPAEEARRERELAERRAKAEARAAKQAEARFQGAKVVWRRASAPLGLLRDYLTARGVDLAALGGIPPTLRLAASLNFWREGQDRRRETPAHAGPAMVAAIGRGRLVGVHRTWITAEGRARHADTGEAVDKKWLGRTGEIHGQPVKLSPDAETMVVGEGLETTLAAFAALVRAGARISAEAALSRGALADAWTPPAAVRRVILLAEGSSKPAPAPGKPTGAEEAARVTRAAHDRLSALGLTVRVVLPGGRWDRDCDAADVAHEFARQ